MSKKTLQKQVQQGKATNWIWDLEEDSPARIHFRYEEAVHRAINQSPRKEDIQQIELKCGGPYRTLPLWDAMHLLHTRVEVSVIQKPVQLKNGNYDYRTGEVFIRSDKGFCKTLRGKEVLLFAWHPIGEN